MPATSASVFEAFLTVVVGVAKLNSDSDKLCLSLYIELGEISQTPLGHLTSETRKIIKLSRMNCR